LSIELLAIRAGTLDSLVDASAKAFVVEMIAIGQQAGEVAVPAAVGAAACGPTRAIGVFA